MVLPTVLKRKHSLKGKQLLPVIRKLRDIQDAHGIKQLARTSSARRTENMSNEDVLKAVEDLTGENGIELLELAGKDSNDEDFAKLLLHVCILHANEKGQPEGQDLQDPELGHLSATTADREQGPTCTSNSRKATDKDQDSNGGKRRKLQDSTTEVKDKDGTQIQQGESLDLVKIDKRIRELNDKSSSSLSKRKDTLKNSLNFFLPLLRKDCTISNCTPDDLKHFLV
nr:uncharacterized protein LOC117684362 isoform X3 [Crassostrea gigas]